MTDGYLCGWRVHSELDLPELVPWTGEDRTPDIVIRLGDVSDRLDDPVENGPFLQIDRRGVCLLRLDNVAAYLVRGPGEVIIARRPGATDVEVRVFLLSSVLGLLCHKRGLLPLRASCIAIDGKAVAFCGPSGVGKSTAAAQFALRGYPLLADDVCVIDAHAAGGPHVLPTFPRLKLWRDSLDALGIACDRLERNRPDQNKFHYICAQSFVRDPIPLDSILLLRTASPGVPDESVWIARPAEKIAAIDREIFRPQAVPALGQTNSLFIALAAIAAATPILRLKRQLDPADMHRDVTHIRTFLAS